MIYELRVYHCVPGRLPALLERFEKTTLGLWARHGICQAGFWTVLVGASNQDLYYLLQWQGLEERERVWTAFMSDPEWIAKRARVTYVFQFGDVFNSWDELAHGAWLTVRLSALSMALGLILAILCALAK